MKKRHPLGRVMAMGLAALLPGCWAVGPDFKRPDPPAVSAYTREPLAPTEASSGPGGASQRFELDARIAHDWWTLFGSSELNALVESALKRNPTIDAAKASLRQARENTASQFGAYFPTVQASYAAGRQRTATASNGLSAVPQSNLDLFSMYTAQLSLSYALDIWGANRRAVESLEAQAESQRFQLEAAHLTLASNVVAAAVQEASLREQVKAAQEIVAIGTKSLDLLRRQFQAGAVTGLDVAAQEAALAQARQALPPLRKQLEQTRDLIAALGGRFPSEGGKETLDLDALQLPEALPVSLPSKLVEQRPDVRAAEEQLHAACAAVGIAKAGMLPQITLTGLYGGVATDIPAGVDANGNSHPNQPASPHIQDLFRGGNYGDSGSNTFWGLGGNISQTLFAGGALVHRKRAAEAALDVAGAQYRSAVLTAFQNVADTLYALSADADSLKAAVDAERAAKRTLDITLKQQQLGAVNVLALLSARQAYQQAMSSRVQMQAARLTDTAALFQALGGGWWNRPDGPAREK